jgi:lysine-N-methylase
MTRFRCIGGDCESSCCTGGWRIPIDREHYDKTKHAMGQNPPLRREFDAKVQRVKGVTGSAPAYALMVLQDDGSCGFFGSDKLCSLQTRFGEGVLSDTCGIYPRSLAQSGPRQELTGLTSCPEVARQLLLHPDAMELDVAPPAHAARSKLQLKLLDHPADPYTRYHDELRNLVFDLLSDDTYPLSSRLCFVSYFASRTVEFLHRGATKLDEERLLAEVERIQNPALRAELHQQFTQLPADPAFASSVVLALMKASVRELGFRTLLDAVVAGYGGQSHAHDGAVERASAVSLEVSQIVPAYEAQKAVWARFAPRIDAYLTNYAKNYWAREWYAGSPDLLTHSVQLLIRIATLRFLLFGHPMLADALGHDDAEKELAVAKATVHAVQKFSRAFEHEVTFTRWLQEQLADAKVISLAHAVCLAKF